MTNFCFFFVVHEAIPSPYPPIGPILKQKNMGPDIFLPLAAADDVPKPLRPNWAAIKNTRNGDL
jgi:hypothetical protein